MPNKPICSVCFGDCEKVCAEDFAIVKYKLTAANGLIEDVWKELERQFDYWGELPSGADDDAEESDESPSDTTAHMAGLARLKIKIILLKLEAWRKHG